MEPFSIICHSCAARLKVAKPDLIDQTLACPKCGSMIHVQHPDGWKPPIPESKGSLSAISSFGNDFDQIEDLLPKAGEPARQVKQATNRSRPKTQAKSKSEKTRFQKPVPPTDAVVHANGTPNAVRDPALKDQPILPGQQWASPSAAKRKKLMLMIGSAIGTVLLVAISIVSIVRLGSETPTEDPARTAVADNGNADVDDQANDDVEDNQPVSPPDDSTTKPEPSTENSNKFLDNEPTIPQLPIEQKNTGGPPPIDLSDPGNNRFSVPDLQVTDPNTKTNVPAGVDPNLTDNATKQPPANTRSLKDVLAAAGISVGELEDVALLLRSFEEARNPKFPMDKPRKKNLNFQRLMVSPIHKLKTPDGISLARAARTLSLLSGVPIAIDPRQLSLMGLPANPTLQLELKDETTLSAAEKIAELAGAKATVVGDGILISIPADEKKADFKLTFPNVGELTDEEKQGFLKAIQALIAPNVWARPDDAATIGYEGDTILLNSSVGVQRHIQMLIDRMNAATELVANPGNAEATATVTSRWSASESLRSKPSGWSVGPDVTLASFLDRVERVNGLTVMVDWPPVLDAGWTPLTMVPGELVEANVGEAINQIAKSMNLKLVGIDEKTLQLTSPSLAREMQDLEVYPLLADWAGKTAPEEIEQLIFNALGQQVQTNFVRVIYEPRCRCLIVVAAQPIQHQVAKLVERLNRVDAAALEGT